MLIQTKMETNSPCYTLDGCNNLFIIHYSFAIDTQLTSNCDDL